MSDFWSRRRAAVEAEEVEAKAAEDAREAAAARDDLDGLDDSEVLARLGLPDPDDLRPGDDVAAFMARAVPHHLRNRALRRLWTSNPVLANLDGLVDYDDDYTGNGLNGQALRTSYEVGKGLAAHVKRVVEAEAAPKDQEKYSENRDDQNGRCDEKNLAKPVADVEPLDGIPSDSDPDGGGNSVRPRMRFSFQEDDLSERPDPAERRGPVRGGPASG